MQEVQRFNKVLKSLVLLGDLILLNLLLWGFNLFLGTRFWCIHCGSIFQGMTLITLCYLLCNMHSGVILHRPVVRPEQIMIRVLRNMVPFVFLSVCTLLVFHFHSSFIILSIASTLIFPSIGPNAAVLIAPAAAAIFAASSILFPSHSPQINAASKLSPAPVASTG